MLKHSILFLAFLLVSSTLFTSCDDDDDDYLGNWVAMNVFGGIPRSYPMTFTVNDVVYVGCGYDDENKDYLKDFWQYDPTLDTWTQVADLGEGSGETVDARDKGVGFAVNGKGYAGTGYNGDDALSDFYCYDPSTDTWSRIADFGVGSDGDSSDALVRYEAVAFGINDYGYVGTGYDTERYHNDFYRYDPSTDYWTSEATVPGTDKRKGAMAFTYEGKGYVVGGKGNDYLKNFCYFDPDEGEWTKLRNIDDSSDYGYDDKYDNIYRQNGVAFVVGGYAYLALGTQSTTWRYNFVTDKWNEMNSFEKTNRSGAIAFTATVTEGGEEIERGFVGFGVASSKALYDVYKFVPEDERDSDD